MISVESMDYSDEDEGNGRSPVSDNGNIQSLDSLMADLGNMVKTPRPDMINTADIDAVRYEYEAKISQMAKRIKMLELSLDSVSTIIVENVRRFLMLWLGYFESFRAIQDEANARRI